MGRIPLAASLTVLGLAVAVPPAGASLRPDDPVVLTGAKVPQLAGRAPASIAAFAWDGRRWRQVPAQVDERAVVDLHRVYNDTAVAGQSVLSYTDPTTLAGPDPDPGIDADDELVFMAADAGSRAPRSAGVPPGQRGAAAAEVRVRDPIDDAKGSVYLFARPSGASPPPATRRYVSYRFTLLAGPYPAKYGFVRGPNPENSVVKTKSYEVRFADRWQMDALRIRSKGASGVDVLDRARAQFAPGVCGRSEDTFDAAEGAFIVNKSGPVRAIRSYIGANSGPLTQRQHIFYADRQDITTFLRVHAIPGVMDVFDYAPEARGMTYRNSLATAGVKIDGVPDSVPTGTLRWEQVEGPQGTLTMVPRLVTTVAPITVSSYYADNATPAPNERPCTGDQQLLGVSGPRISSPLPNTDPRTQPAATLTMTRSLYADPPGGDAKLADRRARDAATPLVAKAVAFSTR